MYNGWTNYETWRINLEIFSDCYEDFYKYTKDELKDYTEDVYARNFDTTGDSDLGNGLIFAFISKVNFYEILEHIEEHWEENHCNNCNEQLEEQGDFCSNKCEKEYWLLADHPKG